MPQSRRHPPGRWVIVGCGRFGQAIAEALESRGIAWQAVDNQAISTPQRAGLLIDDNIERSLHEVAVESASVIVAGTDNDSVNLAISMLARRLNPDIFIVIRQNHIADATLIHSAQAAMRFVQSDLMVHECLQRIHVPMLRSFLKRMAVSGGDQASRCIDLIAQALGTQAPFVWTFDCDIFHAGMFSAFCQGFAKRLQQRFLDDASTMEFVRHGIEKPRTWLFRRLKAWDAARLKSKA